MTNYTNVNDLLLQERKQAFEMAKTVCPEYDAENPFWMEVNSLTTQIANAKKNLSNAMKQHEENKGKISKSSMLANSLLEKVSKDE